jgi:hypothetical protein
MIDYQWFEKNKVYLKSNNTVSFVLQSLVKGDCNRIKKDLKELCLKLLSKHFDI